MDRSYELKPLKKRPNQEGASTHDPKQPTDQHGTHATHVPAGIRLSKTHNYSPAAGRVGISLRVGEGIAKGGGEHDARKDAVVRGILSHT
eukprot:1422127-Prymnesium_polylepis.1